MTHINSKQLSLPSILTLVASVGLISIPVYAYTSSQLISQKPDKVELNLVSFSITKCKSEILTHQIWQKALI